MDRRNNYYLSDLKEDIASFFVNLIGKSYDNAQNVQIQSTLVEYIFRQPFPCLKLLDLLTFQKGWLEFTMQSKILALQKFIESCANEEDLFRFINFLVNVELSNDVFENWGGKIFDIVKKTDDTFYMGLLAKQAIDLYTSHTRSLNKANNYFAKDKILYEVTKNNVHFVSRAVQKQKTFIDITNNYIRNVFILAKAANEFNSVTQSIDEVGNIRKILEGFDLQVASEIQILFFNDLRRLQNSIEFLRKYTSSFIPVEILVETNGILPFIYEHKNIILIGYEEIRQVIETNHAFESQSSVLKQMRDIELETLIYFFVLAAVYEVIINRRNMDERGHKPSQNKINHIKVMLRQIRNIDILCSLIEDIFHLIFLRWEHLQSRSFGKLHENQKRKSTSSTEMETHVELNSGSARHGFICGGTALKCIFVFLKNFITKKLHSEEYKTCSERIQRRFTRIMDCINDALWKYSVLEKISDTDIDNFQMEPQDLLQLVQLHKEKIEKSSSDDESRERNNFASLAKRKARKRRRATFGGGEQQRSEDLTNKDIRPNDLTDIENRKSIIPNMLSTPENLAIMALAMKNFNDVKYIIQTFNLHNTELDRELKFVENQQQTKKKLEAIYESYLLQEMKTTDSVATVEQIKKAAAKGFEASKITSIIDNFAHANTVERSTEVLALLEKYSSSYNFLLNYEGPNIQAVIAVDLILNLNINYDITSNVIPVIRRKCNSPKLSNLSIANTGLPSEMGCLHFLDNICECMRLIKTIARTEIGLQNMLCNNSFSLRPKKIILELQREKIFQTVFYKNEPDLHRIEDLKLLANDFTDFKSKCNYFLRFLSYIVNLSKFLQIRDKNAEFHISALLKFDPCDVIGELIFEENMTPLEIESQVVALNLNLVHVIALNICPEICDKESKKNNYKITKEKYQSIFNYIANQNALLGYLLQKIKGSSQSSNINDEYLERLVRFKSVQILSEIYEGNRVIAALLSTKVNEIRIKKLQKKEALFDIFRKFVDQLQDRNAFHREKDRIIADLVSDDAKYVHLAEHISNINVRASLIYTNFTKVPNSRLAKELIESTLLHKDVKYIDMDLKNKLEQTLKDINIYSKVSSVLELESWPQAYDFGLKTPNMILEKLLCQRQFKLCYEWCNVVRLGTAFSHQIRHFFSTFLDVLIDLREEFDMHLLQTIETFPTVEVCNFYDTHKEKFRSVNLLSYVVDFLWKNARSTIYLKNYKVSLKIFEQLSAEERHQNWSLLSRPLLIVEQLIMNAKFKGLAKVLDSIRPLLEEFQTDTSTLGSLCKFCFDKRGNIYDIHSKNSSNFTLGNESSSAFILLNFNLYQKDHIITSECVDLILRIYATKALDYQIREMSSSSERVSQSTDMASLDSLCGAFKMPKTPPKREEWVKDDEALHCMCCRRAVFTMLMRRHHCRRCGRVVCFVCSSNRMHIPELYEDVAVRVCSDCIKQTQELEAKSTANKTSNTVAEKRAKFNDYKNDDSRWKLSGNITHDKLLREEFCYEHAPSVALCLSILSYHTNNRKCVDLLLYHCGKLEKLLVPNPEVNYELIAKMMNCLALAAKVRGGPPEVETIREHSDIIMSVVQNGCETLIPAGSLNNHNLRKLADSLVQVEKWQLALEIHWKCGFPTAGVMAAHGLACLRAGCFETAREKFSHCMTKLSSERECSTLSKLISNDGENSDSHMKCDIHIIRRPSRSPPLLQEILKMIESVPSYKSQPETVARAAIIRNSNTSLSSLLSKRREHIPLHEPAINILNTLANLKQLSKGHYCDNGTLNSFDNKKQLLRQSRIFEECLHYLYTYGSHSDIINFFITYGEINAALKYFLLQHQDVEMFIHHIFLVFLKTGSVGELIDHMLEIDERLIVWKEVIIGTCRYLETKNLYHCLYELQILLKDPVRASMTCVKFYSMHCQTYQELYANSFHLHNAHRHLQSELEHSQWENISPDRKRKVPESSFLMQMDAKSINAHINTILRQLDVTKFLSHCEQTEPLEEGRLITDQILKQIRIDSPHLPTLFDSAQEKTQICILLLLSGKNIEEGFGLAYRIIQNYKLPSMKVFGATAKYLARNSRLTEVEKLLNCITSNNGTTNKEIDEILTIAIHSATNNHEPEVKTTLDNLAKKINSVELRISSHIFVGQLKSAYLLAIQYNRLNDIRKILRQAEATNQVHIKKLCEKKLNMNK